MTQFGLDGIFNPGQRHVEDERRRLENTREEVGDASGGRRVDLDNGKIVIKVNRSAAAEEPDTGAEVEPEA